MAGDPKYVEKCGKMPNGQVPGQSGAKTPQAVTYHKDLDAPKYGSKVGVMKKGK